MLGENIKFSSFVVSSGHGSLYKKGVNSQEKIINFSCFIVTGRSWEFIKKERKAMAEKDNQSKETVPSDRLRERRVV
ncbi:Uncharacterized protein dnm_006020 [Desulfonema magnum]|uniref:Uncharacterized protein n=1 Tax=Desulfonema magnum TaxID=45655 RepID=A0A975BFZ9_9BACT|nr:Uncharacterized protein dnm_006020 [Desulfonema magnum]